MLVFAVMLIVLMNGVPAAAQLEGDFDVTKMFREIVQQSVHLKSKPEQKLALKLLDSRPFTLNSTPNLNNRDQKYRYYNTMGYYAALGLENPNWAVAWVTKLSQLSRIGQQGLITAINNIGPAPENIALSMLIEKAPAMKAQLERMPQNILEYPAYTPDILVALNGAFYATGRPKYTALMIKGLSESIPGGEQPNAVMTHLIPFILQMQSLLDPTALQAIEYSATLPQLERIAPLLTAIADRSLIEGDDNIAAMSEPAKLKIFFDHMRKLVFELSLTWIQED